MNNKPNLTANYQFTIVVPVYNEEESMGNLTTKLREYLPTSKYKTCVLFVNDGSKDATLDLLIKACDQNEHFFYISFEQNKGLSAAIKAGIDTTYSDYVGYIDADLQTVPEDFNLLLHFIVDYEMVIGIRANREDSLSKKIQSKIANSFRRMMTSDGITDTGCPLKVIRTDYAKRIPFFKGMHRFLPALIQLQNAKVYQMPVRHFPRVAGVSKFNLWNRLIEPFVDCFAYRWMKKRYLNYNINSSKI
ncbi:MAG: glycosyltransferase family 2 protein [Paludibacter sp.]|jgi:glycosyltransferase involved in cell wall biosynthesis|nr:glycosyltransferase family 2 protein [Paludibacter sp.]